VTSYLVEAAVKVIVSSELEQEELMANIYSQISEFIARDEDLVDIELNAFPLPDQHGARPSDLGNGTDPEEGGKTPVP
jgi:hypothetical protein